MKTRKWIAAAVVSIALIAAWAVAHPLRCGTLAAWFPTLDYDPVAAWALPGMALFLLLNPVYDLLALGAHRLGYEPQYEGSVLYPEHGDEKTPLTVGQKVFLVYPITLFFVFGIMAAWSRMVHCG